MHSARSRYTPNTIHILRDVFIKIYYYNILYYFWNIMSHPACIKFKQEKYQCILIYDINEMVKKVLTYKTVYVRFVLE